MGVARLPSAGRWYERGLLHSFPDYEQVPSWLNSLTDPMDDEGFLPAPSGPGLGEDVNGVCILAG